MTNAHKCVVCGAESARKRVYTKDEVIIEDAPPILPEEHFYRGKQWLPASA